MCMLGVCVVNVRRVQSLGILLSCNRGVERSCARFMFCPPPCCPFRTYGGGGCGDGGTALSSVIITMWLLVSAFPPNSAFGVLAPSLRIPYQILNISICCCCPHPPRSIQQQYQYCRNLKCSFQYSCNVRHFFCLAFRVGRHVLMTNRNFEF